MSYHQLTRNATIAVFQVIFSGGVLFLLYRYLLRTIGPEQMGVWSIVLATASATKISEMGFSASAVKYTARYLALGDEDRASQVIQTTVITIGAALGLFLAAGYSPVMWLIKMVIPPEQVVIAQAILPYALVSVWLGTVGGVFLAGLDGCQRIDLRVLVSLTATTVFLGLAWAFVPDYGLRGLGLAQIGQGTVILFGSWLLLRRELPTLPRFFFKWNYSLFREMFNYGVNFQVTSIFIMLFDPTTKALLAKFGGLSSAAYYEMASRMVIQVRSLLLSANQVMVPQIAAFHENAPENIRKAYLDSYRVIFFLSLPLYACLAAVSPLASQIWIGHFEISFVTYTVLLSVGLFVNSLVGPAYFVNLGTGSLRWNTWAHVSIGILNILLGYSLGRTLGGRGVVLGYILALVLGGSVVIIGYHRDHQIPLSELLPIESRKFFIVCCVGLLTSLATFFIWQGFNDDWVQAVLAFAACSIPVSITFWMHPMSSTLSLRVAAGFGRLVGVGRT